MSSSFTSCFTSSLLGCVFVAPFLLYGPPLERPLTGPGSTGGAIFSSLTSFFTLSSFFFALSLERPRLSTFGGAGGGNVGGAAAGGGGGAISGFTEADNAFLLFPAAALAIRRPFHGLLLPYAPHRGGLRMPPWSAVVPRLFARTSLGCPWCSAGFGF